MSTPDGAETTRNASLSDNPYIAHNPRRLNCPTQAMKN
jgi:hypothetical protein